LEHAAPLLQCSCTYSVVYALMFIVYSGAAAVPRGGGGGGGDGGRRAAAVASSSGRVTGSPGVNFNSVNSTISTSTLRASALPTAAHDAGTLLCTV
jgi:hypothetical protein